MKRHQGTIADSFCKYFATLGFIGYLPVAPGTFGSLTAMLFFGLLKPSLSVHIFLLSAIILSGTIASHRAAKITEEKDSRHIVIDEFAGYAASVIFIPASIQYYTAAFFLFRFFDILKPPPLRKIERILPGGIGIMADDLLAGIYTNIVLHVWMLLT